MCNRIFEGLNALSMSVFERMLIIVQLICIHAGRSQTGKISAGLRCLNDILKRQIIVLIQLNLTFKMQTRRTAGY